MFEPYAEKLSSGVRPNNCPWVLVFNPVAVRFRYRHHQCGLRDGHYGFHRCPCGELFDELGVWQHELTSDGEEYASLLHIGGGDGA